MYIYMYRYIHTYRYMYNVILKVEIVKTYSKIHENFFRNITNPVMSQI